MKILNTKWIGGRDTIGIVLIENEMNKQSARIGAIIIASTQEDDAKHVAEWGAKLTFEQAKGFFPNILSENYK